MGFWSSLVDSDVWLCPACKPNGYKYYEYLLACVDDILVLSYDPGKILLHFSKFYCLKEVYTKSEWYLGAQVKEWIFPNDPMNIKWAYGLNLLNST